MNAKSIRQQADFLYSKSSQYIVGLFMLTGTVLAIGDLFSYYSIGFIVALLLAPLEVSTYRALLKAYDRKGREVTTKEYFMDAIRDYRKYASVFIGKKLFIYVVEILIIVLFLLINTSTLDSFWVCVQSVVTGNIQLIFEDGVGLTVGLLLGVGIAFIVGFVLNIQLVLTPYYAIDQDMGLIESIRASMNGMKGKFFKYIRIVLSFIFPLIGNYICAALLSYGFTALAEMCIEYIPFLNTTIIGLLTDVLMAFLTTFVAIMFYRVKMEMCMTVLYKDVVKNTK